MLRELENTIEKLDFENLTILQISTLLETDYDLSQISNAMTKIRKRKHIFPPNVFGKCGIDRRANDCGDASEY